MAIYQVWVVFFGLSVLSCDGSLLKKREDCDNIRGGCVQNVKAIYPPVYEGSGYENLIVNGRFAVNCDWQHRRDARTCFREHSNCGGGQGYIDEDMLVDYNFMCDNKDDFENGAACWMSGHVGATVDRCTESTGADFCAQPGCVEREVAKIPGCTSRDAFLVAEISRNALRSECLNFR